MNLVFLQRIDRSGGGSRASLATTMKALRGTRPTWSLSLATAEAGPLTGLAITYSFGHSIMKMPHFRNFLERPAYWLACRQLAKWVESQKAELVLSNEWVTAPHALEVGRRLQIPAMSYVRDFSAVSRGHKYQLHQMDRLLCVSESMRQELIKVGYDPAKVSTVYNPVLRRVQTGADELLLAAIQERTQVDRWLLYIGRISPRKSQIEAVECLKHLRKITGESWGLLLVGDADKAYETTLDAKVKAEGLETEVLKLGLVETPGWLFDFAHAFVMTSKSEGLARVVIESFLAEKPAFCLPQDGLEDIYGDAMEFFVPASREPERLAEKIARGLSDPVSLRMHTQKIKVVFEARHSVSGHITSFEAAIRKE